MITPMSLRDDYPTLKPILLHLAWLLNQQETHSQKIQELGIQMKLATRNQIPYIKKDIKKHSDQFKFFKNQWNGMVNGDLRGKMRIIGDNPIGVLSDEPSDVRCVWVLRKLGTYTHEVVYSPTNPQKSAILDEASKYGIPVKELKCRESSAEELEQAIEVDKEIRREKSRKSPDHWRYSKSF